jgi:hypothetical protein
MGNPENPAEPWPSARPRLGTLDGLKNTVRPVTMRCFRDSDGSFGSLAPPLLRPVLWWGEAPERTLRLRNG